MASTYSDLKIELIGTGDQTGTWGATTNNNLSVAISEAITGSADVAFSSADVTLTLTDTNAAQIARNLRLNLTGTSGGARNLILGSGCQIEKLYLVNNGLADTVTVKNTSGTGIAVAAGKSAIVFNNGTNVVEVFTSAVNMSIGTLEVSGTSTFGADSTYTGTGQVKMPAGTNAQRSGGPTNGMLRYNTDSSQFEGYAGGQWGGIGGAQAGGAIQVNKTTATTNYTIAAGENGFSVGPITVAGGVTITIASGQRWLVL
jgi:hypothetical protein